jgi:hypothetical protein
MTKSPDLSRDLKPPIPSRDLTRDLNHLTYHVILRLSHLRRYVLSGTNQTGVRIQNLNWNRRDTVA